MARKKIGLVVDIIMYALMLTQMLYVFTTNNVHEIIGVAFFICLIIHLILKGWWFKAAFRNGQSSSRVFFNIVTMFLTITSVVLIISSMGVSRFLFPWFTILGSSEFHRYMATTAMTLAVIHGCMHCIWRAKKKRKAIILTVLACIASVSIGLFAVPYMNRHLKKVDINFADTVYGENIEWIGPKPLVVYFTRVGNTDFDPDVDAVSGASLLISDGELTGSNQLLADMVGDILDCDPVAITLT